MNIPLVLVYGRYVFHYNDCIVDKSNQMHIILLLLLENATNFIQTLDISVLKTFKKVLKCTMGNFIMERSCMDFSKKDVLAITSEVWNKLILMNNDNIVAGFKSSGICLTSFLEMHSRWQFYNDGGAKSKLI